MQQRTSKGHATIHIPRMYNAELNEPIVYVYGTCVYPKSYKTREESVNLAIEWATGEKCCKRE